METLKQRLEEQKERHQGGSKWIGTAGTSPFGAYGYNPEGVRIGQEESRNRRAVKVWDKREFKRPRRQRRDRHPQHQAGAAPAAPIRARGRGDRARPARHHPRDRAQCRHARHEDGAGAAQHGEGAAVPRHRRLDGRPHPRSARSCSRPPRRVQAPRVLLLPQLPLRAAVEEQPPAARRARSRPSRCCANTAPTTR